MFAIPVKEVRHSRSKTARLDQVSASSANGGRDREDVSCLALGGST
jgi:hypothetical protein